MEKRKLKDATCETIKRHADCPLADLDCCCEIRMDEKFGDFFKRNPELLKFVNLEKEVDCFNE